VTEAALDALVREAGKDKPSGVGVAERSGGRPAPLSRAFVGRETRARDARGGEVAAEDAGVAILAAREEQRDDLGSLSTKYVQERQERGFDWDRSLPALVFHPLRSGLSLPSRRCSVRDSIKAGDGPYSATSNSGSVTQHV